MTNESFNETVGEDTDPGDISTLKHFIGPSVLIAVFGTVTNLLSLSYFITQRNSNNRQSRTEIINNSLFIILNVFDILVCAFLSAIILLSIYSYESRFLDLLLITFLVSVQTTGFITCLLSVIRAISIIRPRHNLNVKVMIGAFIIYSGTMVYLNIKLTERGEQETNTIVAHFSVLSMLFIVFILSNILCIAKLAHTKEASWKREATITMGILSAVYCVFNIGHLVHYGSCVFNCGFRSFCDSEIFQATSMYVLLPMNSASNPVVYFLRNREMRRYLKNVWKKMTCRRSEQEVRPEQDMRISNIARDRTEVNKGKDDADLQAINSTPC